MEQNNVQPKKTNKNYKYPMQPMAIPVGAQQVMYPQPIVGQPQPIYQMAPQSQPYQMPIVQPIQRNPNTGNPIVTVPIGPPVPVNPPAATPVVTPQPPVVVMQPQPQIVTVPQPQIVINPAPNMTPMVVQAQGNNPPVVVIKRRYLEDDCCNVF